MMAKNVPDRVKNALDLYKKSAPKAIEQAAARPLAPCPGGSGVYILLDYSGSMKEYEGSRRRIDHLREAMKGIILDNPDATLISFTCGYAQEMKATEINDKEPAGGTPMAEAIELATRKQAKRIIIVSDGQPDNKTAAHAAACRANARIDIVYLGSDHDRETIAFMSGLATATGGILQVKQLAARGGTAALENSIRGLLPG